LTSYQALLALLDEVRRDASRRLLAATDPDAALAGGSRGARRASSGCRDRRLNVTRSARAFMRVE
jgi:hypothetical protein